MSAAAPGTGTGATRRRKVAVVGGTGNVGTATVERLSRRGDVDVVAVARRAPSTWPLPHVAWAVGDLDRSDSDGGSLTATLAGASAVVHAAWRLRPSRDEAAQWQTNVVGTEHLLEAVVAAEVPTVVYLSSIGAYSPGPRDLGVDESWPTDGIATSAYSRQKAYVERLLDRFEADHPEVRVVRLRPALIFQRRAAREITRYFLARRFPARLVPPRAEQLVDALAPFRFQVVHAEDVAAAIDAAVDDDAARGAYNLATEPVLGNERPALAPVVRAAVAGAWHGHITPTDAGWIDLARNVPLMSSARARAELGWAPTHEARATLGELLDGIRARATGPTPPLAADEDGGAVQPDGTSPSS